MNIRKWLQKKRCIYKSLWVNDQVVSSPPSKLASLGVIFQPINSWSQSPSDHPASHGANAVASAARGAGARGARVGLWRAGRSRGRGGEAHGQHGAGSEDWTAVLYGDNSWIIYG
jgi:hypothetical protein